MSAENTGAVIQKPSYTHAAMVDLIAQNPMVSQREIAYHFGYTEGWVSQILRSDALQELLAKRKNELQDPALLAALQNRLDALAHRSVDILMDALDTKKSPEVALKALELTTRAKGYGAQGLHLTQNFVVAMPQKAASGDEWMAEHRPQPMRSVGGNPTPVITIDTVIDAAA